MRRTYKVLTLIALPALLAVSACTSSSGGSSSSTTALPTANASQAAALGADGDVAVSGAFDKQPTVSIPSATASSNLAAKTLIEGTGPTFNSNSVAIADYTTYLWDGKTNKMVGTTYASGGYPQEMQDSQMLPGLVEGLNGKTQGSRVLVIVPPADAYGSGGDPQEGLSGSDTLVFVIDILGVYPGSDGVTGTMTQAGAGLPTVTGATSPKITIPSSAAPSGLEAKTLIQGSGPVVKAGQYILAQYVGVNWRTGKQFDSSWSRKTPLWTEIGAKTPQVITGWNALEGHTVGSRVLLIIPPADGYGKSGQSSAGIKGTDTLVFEVDILAAYNTVG
jgi:FKBP-type peptidyl-prolyl cis-trans isomerase